MFDIGGGGSQRVITQAWEGKSTISPGDEEEDRLEEEAERATEVGVILVREVQKQNDVPELRLQRFTLVTKWNCHGNDKSTKQD